jgi:hypothetical protein
MVAVVALILAITAPELWANDDDGDEIPFDVANIFFELNDTDGDLGIHALIDGEPWKRLEIEGPRERRMLDVRVKGRLRRQGLTEIFFESAEPTFDELSPRRFFRRFPEGEYEIEGVTLEGDELESTAELTHVMPAPAGGITLTGDPIDLEEVDCDDEETVPSVEANGAVTISWDPVTMSHPNAEGGGAAVQPPIPVTIINYEVVVEVELEVGGVEFTSVFSIILPPEVTAVTIPAEFLAQSDEFKYEILAREESYNQTAVESCFEVDDE